MTTQQQDSERSKIEQRLYWYNNMRTYIHHPTEGMAKRGYLDNDGYQRKFTPEEIEAAEDHIDDMIDFYLDLLEQY